MMRAMLGLAIAAVASGYYKLEWLGAPPPRAAAASPDRLRPNSLTSDVRAGDYQTGAFDTDAAENVAYDVKTGRAFVASAETGVLKVVSIANPTNLEEVATLNVGANLNSYCDMESCIYPNMDFGGHHNPCGYAKMVKYITNYGTTLDIPNGVAVGPDGNLKMVPYVYDDGSADTWEIDATMTSPEACQTKCQSAFAAAYFSYELEYEDDLGKPVHECFCKADYTSGEASNKDVDLEACHHFTYWEIGALHELHAEDGDWAGASGPVNCGKFKAESVQSVAVITLNGACWSKCPFLATQDPAYTPMLVGAPSADAFPCTVNRLRQLDRRRGLTLGVRLGPRLPHLLRCDHVQLPRVRGGGHQA